MYNWDEDILPLASDKYQLSHDSNVLRKRMESGYTRQRRRYTTEFEAAGLAFDFTEEEYSIFKSTWFNRINAGADWFTMRLPLGDGNQLTLTTVRFTDDYKANYSTYGNWRVSAPIEFKTVVRISDLELANIEAGGATIPYPDRGVSMFFNDNNPQSFFNSTAVAFDSSSGFYAMQFWDGTVEIAASGSGISKTFPTYLTGAQYRVEAWSCISAVDSSPLGNLSKIGISQDGRSLNLSKFDTSRAVGLKEYGLLDVDNLEGFKTTSELVIPITAGMFDVVITGSTRSNKITIDNSNGNTVGDIKFDCGSSPGLRSVEVISAIPIPVYSLGFDNCDLTGSLDLSNITASYAGGNLSLQQFMLNPFLTSVTHGGGACHNIEFNDTNISSITFESDISFNDVFDARNANLSVQSVRDFVENVLGDGSSTMYLAGNPCVVDGVLDAGDPLSAEIYAIAVTNNFTIDTATP
jgi:hypothetical protein